MRSWMLVAAACLLPTRRSCAVACRRIRSTIVSDELAGVVASRVDVGNATAANWCVRLLFGSYLGGLKRPGGGGHRVETGSGGAGARGRSPRANGDAHGDAVARRWRRPCLAVLLALIVRTGFTRGAAPAHAVIT